jgi:UDP-N-acetylmuramyl pentapeptide phosphotransferase/UDP-N-acetylglucosamine-1-phosphate transferase
MIYLAISLAVGFLVTFLGIPFAKKYLLASGIYGIDQQKKDKPKVATSGGLVVFFGFVTSLTFYMGINSLFGARNLDMTLLLAALASVNIITLIGLIDDIHIDLKALVKEEIDLEEEPEIQVHEKIEEVETHGELILGTLWEIMPFQRAEEENGDMHRRGLGQLPKMLFVLPAAFPLIAVGAGSWSMTVPFIGYTIHWGLLYPLLLLPAAMLFVSNVINMLAGTNGLSALTSLVASTSIAIYAYLNQQTEAMLIAATLSVTLLAFLRYNMYQASILPGDSLTYLCGAAIFSAVVIGNMEKFGSVIFLPWIAEFVLKARSGFQARSWGILQPDGTLEPQHDKIYSLTHVFMRKGLNEMEVTYAIAGLQLLVSVSALLIFTLVI